MISTGNHCDFDSLRGTPRPYQALPYSPNPRQNCNIFRRDAGDGIPYEGDGAVGNGFIRSMNRVRHTECMNAFPTDTILP